MRKATTEELLDRIGELEQENNIMRETLSLVNDHAESCAMFIYDARGCTCFYERTQQALEKVNGGSDE